MVGQAVSMVGAGGGAWVPAATDCDAVGLTLQLPRVNRDDHRAGTAVHPIWQSSVLASHPSRGHIAQRAGRASASYALSGVFDVRAIGVIMVDVAGGAVVPNGTLVTTSVLLVSNPGCANLRVAWITSITGNSRRSTKIRATSR